MEKRGNRYCVIMCGGVGSRFWPFSRSSKPKQFLDFFGTGRSLLQMTVDRVLPLISEENILLLTNEEYHSIIREQLPMIPEQNILLEPARRNTAPCLCWAAKHIEALNPEAAMVVLPSDHLVLKEDEFRECLLRGFDFVEEGDRLLTLGILPSNPNTGYGYIQQGKEVGNVPGFYEVKSFTEKPELQMAEIFVQSGEFFWNAGIFMWRVDAILNAFRAHAAEINDVFDVECVYSTDKEKEFIAEKYEFAPSISVDYAIMEKAPNVYMQTVEFGWSDLGTWRAFYDTSEKDADGNAVKQCRVMATDCKNTVFAVNGDKVVVAAGLNNYIVAENENALLIYPMKDEQDIRTIVNDVENRFGRQYK